MALVGCTSQVGLLLYVLFEVIIISHAYLAVVVVRLWLRNRNDVPHVPLHSFSFRALSYLGYLSLFQAQLFNIFKFRLSVDFLFESLTGVHAKRTIGNKLVNIVL